MFALQMAEKELRDMLKVVLKTFDLRELIHIIPKEDYLLVLEEAKYFMEDSVISEIHAMPGFFSKNKIASRLNNGFEFDR
ncbi:hypothetical protein KsCSTR_33420 [Candidatus Kuenenia stuttgartiensis]|uniref:Uncharacterized protein n=2 Tax=Candidatus Brocadiaceae TaxID=1127830 RepID=Q1Q4G0_KUEST|nr:hypothetical protein [Candidatus Kuenenia stuttgartiensis]QII12721.1 hypothetical protein KsCSTR_33420 [Candidatus Kuenenia stuttgartiensis]GJQ47952.1 MAG: hypothetical protein HKUEN01_03380 [Candidatus Kuenenia stuttgartiensis]CAJ74893.1 unknown protein [Candidatus Kuenenia stuttgartiensis]SOH02969.1 hypothetical protein KSMBR1_0455 [Candidatus Kuenenia stuttgartiensis]